MAQQFNSNQASQAAKTDAKKVRQQNQQSAQGLSNEFSSELTNTANVRQQNQQAEANKSKNVGQQPS